MKLKKNGLYKRSKKILMACRIPDNDNDFFLINIMTGTVDNYIYDGELCNHYKYIGQAKDLIKIKSRS